MDKKYGINTIYFHSDKLVIKETLIHYVVQYRTWKMVLSVQEVLTHIIEYKYYTTWTIVLDVIDEYLTYGAPMQNAAKSMVHNKSLGKPQKKVLFLLSIDL